MNELKPTSPSTASEWLEETARSYAADDVPTEADVPTILTALAMLRDAKAELDNGGPGCDGSWDAIEARWREGKYRG